MHHADTVPGHEVHGVHHVLHENYTVELTSGKYVIGTDFPAGVYKFEAKGAYSSTQVKVYKDVDAKIPSDSYVLAELYQSSVIGKLNVEPGNILEISGSVVTVSAYNAAQIPLSIATITPTNNEQNQLNAVDGLPLL